MTERWPAPNFALLDSWNDPANERPPTRGNLRDPDKMPQSDIATGEIHQEAYNSHLILDLLGVPGDYTKDGYAAALDARVSVLAQEYAIVTERLSRIADWHSLETGENGTVGLYCNECGHTSPCDTKRMADGIYEDDTDD